MRKKTHSPSPLECGNVLVEATIIIWLIIIIFIGCFEIAGYLRQRQLAQMISREGSVRAYKRCSGYRDPSTTRPDAGRIEGCLQDVSAEVLQMTGAVPGAALTIGLFRCVPRAAGPCQPQLIRASATGSMGGYEARLANASDPFTQLVSAQHVVIVSQASWAYQPIWGMLGFLTGVRDVTIL